MEEVVAFVVAGFREIDRSNACPRFFRNVVDPNQIRSVHIDLTERVEVFGDVIRVLVFAFDTVKEMGFDSGHQRKFAVDFSLIQRPDVKGADLLFKRFAGGLVRQAHGQRCIHCRTARQRAQDI